MSQGTRKKSKIEKSGKGPFDGDDTDDRSYNSSAYLEIIEAKEEIIRSKEEIISAKEIIIKELYENISLLKEKIEFMGKYESTGIATGSNYAEVSKVTTSEKTAGKISYSSALKKEGSKSLFVKPKNNQEALKTKLDIMKVLKPVDLNINLRNIQQSGNGSLKITCANESEVEKMNEVVRNKLNSNYDVRIVSNLQNPKVKVVGIEGNLNADELVKIIKEQNCFIEKNAVLNVKKIKQMKTRCFAIIECDPKTYYRILENGILCVNLSICSVYEHLSVLRCFNCSGYYHVAEKCSNASFCMKCGQGGHKADQCQNTGVCCPNCLEFNKKFKLNLNTNHSAFDKQNCTVMIKKLDAARKQTNYCIE